MLEARGEEDARRDAVLTCDQVRSMLDAMRGRRLTDVLVGPADLSFELHVGASLAHAAIEPRGALISCPWLLVIRRRTVFDSVDMDDDWHLESSWRRDVMRFFRDRPQVHGHTYDEAQHGLMIALDDEREVRIRPSGEDGWTVFYDRVDASPSWCSFYEQGMRFEG